MHKKRLLKLADFLETVPREKFALTDWEKSPATKPEGKKPGECGFAGCAMGWAAHAKLFPGLCLAPFWGGTHITYRGDCCFGAGEKLFSIAGDQALQLFDGDCYPNNPTPKQVAKRIRKFVETGHV